MCRILGYVGEELPIDSLLLEPENSLIRQTLDPELHPVLQLAGWGFGAWSEHLLKPEKPLIYRRPSPAFHDKNAEGVIPSLQASTLLAHVRADHYDAEGVLADENCHPINSRKSPWIMAHNGNLPHWRLLQRELLKHCKDEHLAQVGGCSDSEFLYVLFLSILEGDGADDVQRALQKLLSIIADAMKKLDLVELTKLKIVLATRDRLIGVNYGLGHEGEAEVVGDWRELRKGGPDSDDFRLSMLLEPMYVLRGKNFQQYKASYDLDVAEGDDATLAIIASEPLTDSTEDWCHLEFGQMICIERSGDSVRTTLSEMSA